MNLELALHIKGSKGSFKIEEVYFTDNNGYNTAIDQLYRDIRSILKGFEFYSYNDFNDTFVTIQLINIKKPDGLWDFEEFREYSDNTNLSKTVIEDFGYALVVRLQKSAKFKKGVESSESIK